MLLVHTSDSDPSDSLNDNIKKDFHEVLFLRSSNPGLDADNFDISYKAIHFLTHQISRDPDDLRSHVKRIHLYVNLKDPDGVFGSVLDLFIALSNNGIAIRRRMLSMARPQLSMPHRIFLSQSLQLGLASNDILPEAPCSVLTLSYSGVRSIVTDEDAKQEKKVDPIKLAQDYIEYGQIDDALDLLECAVVDQPWRKDIHTELLSLYRATHDIVRSEQMYQKLADSSIPDHIEWKDTLQYVRQFSENA